MSSPQIEDPVGDANFLNSQAVGSDAGLPFFGNVVAPRDISDAGDIRSVWFSHSERSLFVNIETEAPLSANSGNLQFPLFANINPFWNAPDMEIWASFSGTEARAAILRDTPCSPDALPARASARQLSSGAGLVRVVVPRKHCPGSLGSGTILSPQLVSSPWEGDGTRWLGVAIDNTVQGRDYVLGDD